MIEARAPGKLVLSGDYAVLFGAPAIAASVNRYARVSLEPRSKPGLHITSTGAVSGDWVFEPASIGQLLSDMAEIPELGLTALVLGALNEKKCLPDLANGSRLAMDTRELAAGDTGKYGLGSSAAVLVALLAVLQARGKAGGLDVQIDFASLHAQGHLLHQRFQSGRGSGIDIAVASHGGCVAFSSSNEPGTQPSPEAREWPEGLQALVIWTGISASTSMALNTISRAQHQSSPAFRTALESLLSSARRLASAFRSDGTVPWLQAVTEQYVALERFGKAVDVDIVSEPHRRIHDICSRYGWVYKPSGAGIGDCGIAFASEASDTDRLRSDLMDAGYKPLDLELGTSGPCLQAGR